MLSGSTYPKPPLTITAIIVIQRDLHCLNIVGEKGLRSMGNRKVCDTSIGVDIVPYGELGRRMRQGQGIADVITSR